MASDPAGPGARILEKVLALHTIPSSVAFSALGPRLTPAWLGIGRPGHVAVTFDDGPHPVATPRIADLLAELGWHATFFVLGSAVERDPGLVRELEGAGHDVGVHAYAHRTQRHMTPGRIRADVERAHGVLVDAGVTPAFYRPPHGALSPEALLTARRLGMRPVLWTAWGRDWRAEATPASVRDDVACGRLDGGTVLLHDSDCASAIGSWTTTVDALPLLAELFAARSLAVGSLREHLAPAPAPSRTASGLAGG
ncbi:MAG: polysaccharide deacetylase family protein [Acidimicrobiia bacterium]